MANKTRDYDNSPFLRIAGVFSSYDTDLTKDAKEIITRTIKENTTGNSTPYSNFKVYYVLYHTTTLSIGQVQRALNNYQDYYGKDVNKGRVSEDTVKKFRRIVKNVSIALVQADKQGVQLFMKQKENHHYMDNTTFDSMIRDAQLNGASVEELIVLLQNHCGNKGI